MVTEDNAPFLTYITQRLLVEEKLKAHEIGWMLEFAQDHKFWSKRIVNLVTFARALRNTTETGLMAQYRASRNTDERRRDERKFQSYEKIQEAEMLTDARRFKK